jgi:hypothetical protein
MWGGCGRSLAGREDPKCPECGFVSKIGGLSPEEKNEPKRIAKPSGSPGTLPIARARSGALLREWLIPLAVALALLLAYRTVLPFARFICGHLYSELCRSASVEERMFFHRVAWFAETLIYASLSTAGALVSLTLLRKR